ncbi:MAG: 16S rRNA (adenine(1518)-N(6)/adenine(1519)-N(6))-dimethyltransferase RsmA [Actinomycetia bacterium]|nr:16S rRNA (adenine(1518)-N(6)/adenine(1519)-N(6))-dimethyltransferase RsmA [Actinomycetes bacterium]
MDVTDRRALKAFFTARGLAPQKRFGQHFLTDPGVVARIVALVGAGPGVRCLEIGPGPGALTGGLLGAGASVLAIEIDRGFAQALRERWAGRPLVVLEADALRISWHQAVSDTLGPGPLKIVGNLPYYIAGALVARLWEEPALPWEQAVLMVQREAARRLLARPGESGCGAPSVLLHAVAEVRRAFDVAPRAFYPVPTVTSTVVEVRRTARELPPGLAAVVRAGFAHRRKTLRQALAGLGPGAAWWDETLRGAGVDPDRRAETLRAEEWRRVAAAWAEKGRDEACGSKAPRKAD